MIIFELPEQMRKYHEFKGDDIRKGSEIDLIYKVRPEIHWISVSIFFNEVEYFSFLCLLIE